MRPFESIISSNRLMPVAGGEPKNIFRIVQHQSNRCSHVVLLFSLSITLLGPMGTHAWAYSEADHLACINSANVLRSNGESLKSLSLSQLENLSKSSAPAAAASARILAGRYESGTGITKDLHKAVQLYRRAAFIFPSVTTVYSPGFGNVPGSTISVEKDGSLKVGDVAALKRLGEMYRDGIGIDQDDRQAKILLDCAARLESASPQPLKASTAQSKNIPTGASSDLLQQITPSQAPRANSDMLDHEITTFTMPAPINAMAWSPDGASLAVNYDRSRKLSVVDFHSRQTLWHRERAREVTSATHRILQFSADGASLWVPAPVGMEVKQDGLDQAVARLSVRDGTVKAIFKYERPPQGPVTAFAGALDDRGHRVLVVVPGTENKIVSFDQSGQPSDFLVIPSAPREFRGGFGTSRLAIDAGRDTLWWAHEGYLQIVRLGDGHPLLGTKAFNTEVRAAVVNTKTGELVAGGSADVYGTRDPATGPMRGVKSYQDDPTTLVRSFNPADGRLTRTYLGPGGSVEGLAVSPDGHYIAAAKSKVLGASSSYILLWDARSGELLSSKDCGSDNVGDVSFDSAGKMLAYSIGEQVHISQILQ